MEERKHSSSGDSLSLADESVVGTCAICLDSIYVHNEAFVYDCFHHFCFKCILDWSKRSLRRERSVHCPVCRLPFAGIIHCFEAKNDARMYDVLNDSDSPWAIEGFRLSPVQMRRRSLYLDSLTMEVEGAEKQTANSIPICNLERPAFKLWLVRELQSILLIEDVQLIAEHLISTLLQQIGATKKSGTQVSAPVVQRYIVLGLIESSASPYTGKHSKRLAQEALKFIKANLTLEAYDLSQEISATVDTADSACDVHEHLARSIDQHDTQTNRPGRETSALDDD